MTSGNFQFIDPAQINANRENRQRRELTHIDELAESIRNIGLINPLVVDKNYLLVAGERRLTACLQLGLNPIPVQFVEDLDEAELHLIELEENIKRVSLSWRDNTIAVEEYHRLRQELDPEWSTAKTSEAMGVTPEHITRHLMVAKLLDNPLVGDADKFSKALNASQRITERKLANETQGLDTEINAVLGGEPSSAPKPAEFPPSPLDDKPASRANIETTDFNHWARNYRGAPFNLIHCDFPYGVGVGDKSGQSARGVTGSYEDTPEVYFQLLETFCNYGENFIDPSAHLVFWFSMDYYQETISHLESAGWSVSRFPLIWSKSDNAGIIPDANRGPRRTYETALFAARGDRKIVRAVANSIAAPTSREFHTSEKPRPVLHHFLRMLTDEHSRVFDPTAGSGNAIRVAESLGAATCLGLELNPEYAAEATRNLSQGALTAGREPLSEI